MSLVENWHSVVMNVQKANLDKQHTQKQMQRVNKRIYKEELDREVQSKHYQYYKNNQTKVIEREQAKSLAEAERLQKINEKKEKKSVEKKYGEDNLDLIDYHKKVKTASQEIQRKNIQKFLEHPFIKLVEEQEQRNQSLKTNWKKQNQINQNQQQIKKKAINVIRYKQNQQRNDFINHVQQAHQKRSQQRERFKNKYLRIKKSQYAPASFSSKNFEPSYFPNSHIPIQQMYVSYLHNQIQHDRSKKAQEKSQRIDDDRIERFYSKNNEPDSSPAYLGRNPLNYERRRQLYYINKHLLTNHNSEIGNIEKVDQKLPATMFVQKGINPEETKLRGSRGYHFFQNQQKNAQIKPYYTQNARMQTQKSNLARFNQKGRDSFLFNNQSSIQSYQDLDNRRIKSELHEQKSKLNFELPSVHARSNSISYNTEKREMTSNSEMKRQYKRYDLISGKHVTFFA